jgi:acyl-homoserine lactone acylase PvdQ
LPADEPASGWEADPVAAEGMPALRDPPEGFIATANSAPPAREHRPFLGIDWWDGYRAARITRALAERRDWDVGRTLQLQLDVDTLCWDEVRRPVMAAIRGDDKLALAVELLEHCDGNLASTSPAASLYELFLARMTQRAVAARAPRSTEWALGRPFTPLAPYQAFAMQAHRPPSPPVARPARRVVRPLLLATADHDRRRRRTLRAAPRAR